MNWVGVAPAAPYFVTDDGAAWTPIGQNEALSWTEWHWLWSGADAEVAGHLAWLRAHGVTVLRFMLEYAETGTHFFEAPDGTPNPALVAAWDRLIPLVEAAGLRLLLTPLDTYFQWVRWDQHPFNTANGGPCGARTQLMTHPAVRARIKARLEFATRRWGGSGVIFAWDLWNEMHPVQGEDRPGVFDDYINDVGPFLRNLECQVHGRAHPQCVSVFGPELHWKPWLNEPVFRHPLLDFANNHFYEEGTIDHPADTVAPAIAMGKLVQEALAEITDGRPFFDSEHGPIHTFKDHGITLAEAFDDEYFRHCQWAHLASGGAGGGMRWPNRDPHALTPGMRRAQAALAGFLPLIDWPRFQRCPLEVTAPGVACFACGDGQQAVLWLLRTGLAADGRVDRSVTGPVTLHVPGMSGTATLWDTQAGTVIGTTQVQHGKLTMPLVGADVAVALSTR